MRSLSDRGRAPRYGRIVTLERRNEKQAEQNATDNDRELRSQSCLSSDVSASKHMGLLGYLAHQVISPVTRKGLFSGKHVWFAEYLSHAQLLYEISAVLGYTYRDKLETFAELFSEPGRQADLAHVLVTATSVADRLAALPDEPKDIYGLFFVSEGKKLMKAMHNGGLTQFSNWSTTQICRCLSSRRHSVKARERRSGTHIVLIPLPQPRSGP